MESRKVVLLNLFAGKEWRCRCRELTYGHGEGRRGGMNGQSNINMCTLSCKIDS